MKKLLIIAAHLVTLTGLLVASSWWLLALSEGVHAHGHTGHDLSLFAQVLGDFTALPLILPVYLAITLGLLLVAQGRGTGFAGPSATLLSFYPITTGLWHALTLVGTWVLWQWDLKHLPPQLTGWFEPFPFCLWVVPAVVFSLGLYALVAYQVTRAPFYPYAYAILPVLAAVTTTVAFPARWLEVEWRFCLPDAYPRLPWVLGGIGFLVGAYVAVRWLWARALDRSCAGVVAAIVVGAWCWALMSFVVLVAIEPYHHLCLTSAYIEVQQLTAEWLTAFFACLWCLIGGLCLGRGAMTRPDRS